MTSCPQTHLKRNSNAPPRDPTSTLPSLPILSNVLEGVLLGASEILVHPNLQELLRQSFDSCPQMPSIQGLPGLCLAWGPIGIFNVDLLQRADIGIQVLM